MIKNPEVGQLALNLTSSCFTYEVEVIESDMTTSLVKTKHGDIRVLNDDLYRVDDHEGLKMELRYRMGKIEDELQQLESRMACA